MHVVNQGRLCKSTSVPLNNGCAQDPKIVTSRTHVTVAQWNHLLAICFYLYKNFDDGYNLMMAINQFEIDDWEPLYYSLLDFKYKLRDVYMWWAQTVPGRSVAQDTSTTQTTTESACTK